MVTAPGRRAGSVASRTLNRGVAGDREERMDADLDKRGSPRVRADYAVEYLIAGKGADGRGRSVDLSESGIRFVCTTRLSPGAYLMVRVRPRGAWGCRP